MATSHARYAGGLESVCPELWLLDDGRTFGGGQLNALRMGRYLTAELPQWSVRVLCPGTSELAKRCLAAAIPVSHAVFPDATLAGVPRMVGAVRSLRREFATAGMGVIVVGGSMRAQAYAHAAAIGLTHPPPLVQFMTEQDSATRSATIWLLRRFGAIVAIGSNAARAYEAALPNNDVVKVNNFLLPSELEGTTPRASTREGLPVLGVLARLIPEKGILELIDDLAGRESSWATLRVGGNADDAVYARRVEERVAELELGARISLLGHVDDVAAFLAGVDVLIVPSTGNEGQPTVILEALANDMPVLVRSHVWSDDFDGLPVFPYRDAADLARLLEDGLPVVAVDHGELDRRFGPQQALDGIGAATLRARRKRKHG